MAWSKNAVFVGDSKDPDGPVLAYTKAQWQGFVTSIKLGEHDRGLG